jgi:hypothetical protein
MLRKLRLRLREQRVDQELVGIGGESGHGGVNYGYYR